MINDAPTQAIATAWASIDGKEVNDGYLSEAAEMIARLEKRGYAVVPGWQPIETAPKDGTQILSFNQMQNIYEIVYWNLVHKYWASGGCYISQFTHWVPLPPAPKGGE